MKRSLLRPKVVNETIFAQQDHENYDLSGQSRQHDDFDRTQIGP